MGRLVGGRKEPRQPWGSMERNLFRYILVHSRSEQAVIFVVALASQLFYFVSLDLPKTIVNVIQGKGFPSPEAKRRVLAWAFGPWDWLQSLGLPSKVTIFSGIQLDQLSYLWALSLLFLVFVFINGGFKIQINTTKGRWASACCAACATSSVDRVLRFPLPQFSPREAGRNRHHDQGRGGAPRRLHRRCLRRSRSFSAARRLRPSSSFWCRASWLGASPSDRALQAVIIPKLESRC